MRVYHERLRVPVTWWLLGVLSILLLGAELFNGFGWLLVAVVYAALGIPATAALLLWGRHGIEVSGGPDGALRAGHGTLALAAAGEVAALDEHQTRALAGPRADPAAFLLLRPYLRRAVYVEVTDEDLRVPYWLVCTRHPDELAAAIERSRPAARAGDRGVG